MFRLSGNRATRARRRRVRNGATGLSPSRQRGWTGGRITVQVRAVMLLIGLGSPIGCAKPISVADCEALLLRYVSLLAASDRPETSTAERLHMQELAKQKAAQDPEFGKCGKSISRVQFECALLAPSTDEFERCLM